MQANSTDDIALRAWHATKNHWAEFILFPILVTIGFSALAVLNFIFVRYGLVQLLIQLTLCLSCFVFSLSFWTALAKWNSEIHSGKKTISIKAGMKYGFSRFWGVLGTSLLTGIKIFLWSLLLFLPGLYKGMQYLHSVQVSQIEKISGGDANKLSKAVIMNAGILRSFSNMIGFYTFLYFVIVAIFFVLMIVITIMGVGAGLSSFGDPNMFEQIGASVMGVVIMVITGIISMITIPFIVTYFTVFTNYHYLILRDEQKTAFTAAKKKL